MQRFCFGFVVACCLTACSSTQEDRTPVGALELFLDAMDRSAHDSSALRDAYRLLDERARAILARRAERATALAGYRFEPWDMLPPGRFRLRFAKARRGGMRARISGDEAVVVVRGDEPGQRAEVPLVREQDAWRIRLDIPRSEPPKSAPAGGAAASE